MNAATILIFGHSHANCLAAAVALKTFSASDANLEFRVVSYGSGSLPGGLFLKTHDDREVLNPIITFAIEQEIARKRDVWFVSVLFGQFYCKMGLLQDREPFMVLHPEMPATPVPPGTALIPFDAAYEMFRRQNEPLRRTFELLSQAPVAGVMHLDAPPPIPSNEFILEHIPPRAAELSRSRGADAVLVVNPPELRMALWQTQRDAVSEICRATGAQYIWPPSAALDANGYCLPFTWKDAMHCSTEYGGLALREIEQAVLAKYVSSPAAHAGAV